MEKHTKSKPKSKENLNLKQQSAVRTVHTCMHITMHNCHTQYNRQQFW